MIPYEWVIAIVTIVICGAGYAGYYFGAKVKAKAQEEITKVENIVKKF